MPGLEQAIKKLEETATVMAGIQARQASMLRDHSEWLQEHDKAVAQLDQGALEAQARGEALDTRIEKLVIAIGKLIASRPQN